MLRTWWKRLRSRRTSLARPRVRSHVLGLESLETRLVPAAVIRSGTGATTAALTPFVDQFRRDLGDPNNGNLPPAATGRREINWDGAGAPDVLPGNFFNTVVPRGLVSINPGGFRLSRTTDPLRFGDINDTYTNTFTTFSSPRLFTPTGSTTSEHIFFRPGTTIPATVSGFGAVFTDVDSETSTTLEFIDPNNNRLGNVVPVPVLNGGLSFVGVFFDAGERVAKVKITSGNTILAAGANDGGANDVVVMDDFIYSEPQPVQFQFSSATYTTNEVSGTALVTVTRTGGTFGAASVVLTVADGTAQNGSDYVFATTPQTLNFAAGEASKIVAIPIHDDFLMEGLETLRLTLTNPSGIAVLGTPTLAILTIVDNETPPTTLLGLTNNSRLVRFDAANPGTILSTVTITGLQAGESVLGIDYRPATGQLYGLGSTSRLYVLNPTTGAATLVGADAFTPALSGASFGVDFNPFADLLRVVSDTAQNLRLNPTTGAVAGTDTALSSPNVVASAYTNNFAGTTRTTLYGIDSNLDRLVLQGGLGGTPSPNLGAITTVAPLGFDVQPGVGFDIAAIGNQAFAAMTVASETTTRLFTINLTPPTATTSVAAPIGAIGGPDPIIGLAVVPPGAFQFSAAGYAAPEVCPTCVFPPGTPLTNTVTITVTRTGGSDGVAAVNYNVTAGTATAGTDFQTTSGILAFNSGETSKTFTVTLLGDSLREGIETVLLSLTNPTGGTILGGRATATLTILDDQTPRPFFYALTNMNKLLRVDAANPGTLLGTVTISGLQPSENILGIDYRPANGMLYGLGSTSRLYTINPTSGVATQVGSGQFAVLLAAGEFGFDFNPQVDRLRVVSSTGQNFRLNPTTGLVEDFDPGTPGVQPDTNLAYGLNDVNTGATPNVVGSAYTNNVAGTATTTLFGLDSARGQLVRQGGVNGPPSPNLGQLTTIGSLGTTVQTLAGFDIGADGTALAALTATGETVSKLYEINLATGAAIDIGDIGSAELIRGMTIIPAGVIQFTSATFTVVENAVVATITLTRTGGTEGAVTGTFATSDGTGRAGIDYTTTTGTVTFAAGTNSASFQVPIRDNGRADASRTVNLALTGATAGATLGTITSAVLTITDNDAGLTQNQRFVTQAFVDLLNRPPEPAALAGFTNFLSSGGTRDQVTRGIAGSVEYRTLLVRGLYQKYLRRDADQGGLNAFVGVLNSGGRVETIIVALVGSQEYFNGPGGGTNAAFLRAAYQDFFGRGIDSSGESLFTQLLGTGTSRSQVATILNGSDEGLRAVVGGFYTRLLGRTGDSGGITAFVGFLRGGGRQEDIIAVFVSSAEYFGRL